MRLVLAIFLLAAVVFAQKKDYTGYKLVHVMPGSLEKAQMLADLEINSYDFDVWNSVKKDEPFFEVLLSPEAFVKYSAFFKQHQMSFSVIHDNIQEANDAEERELAKSRMEGKVVGTYPRFDALLAWMDTVEAANPTIVSQFSIGKSFQNRDLRVLRIKVGSPAKKIWFDCGIHAREWISPATCVNLIDKFIKDYQSGVPEVVTILQNYELQFLPAHNPDGYEYAQTTDRYWRKNRKTNPGSTCVGVDLNRNFPFQWLTGGSSTDPCSDTHAGSSAGSESEAKAVIDHVTNNDGWAAFLTIHSYGNWFLTAYGHTTALSPDYTTHKATGDVFAAAVKSVYGEIFTVGSTANLLYIASGASSDWGYGGRGILHSYTIELRPRNGFGVFGFVLAETQIPLVGNEIYAGIKALIRTI